MSASLPKISSKCRLPKNMTAQEWLALGEDTARDDARLAGLTMVGGSLSVLWGAKRVHRALPIERLDDADVAQRLQSLLTPADWAVLAGYVADFMAGKFDEQIAEGKRLQALDVGF